MRDWVRLFLVVIAASGSLLHAQAPKSSSGSPPQGHNLGTPYHKSSEVPPVDPDVAELTSLAVRNVRLEPAPPIEELTSASLKFDVQNEGSRSLTDIVLTASLFETPAEGHGADPPAVRIAGPFMFRAKAVLVPGYTISYELRFRNISADCGCVVRVDAVAARVLPRP